MEEWSDEEGEILPDSVDEYCFVDESDKPVKFSLLPLKWHNEDDSDSAGGSSSGVTVFLRGDQSLCRLAKAWKFDLSDDEQPKIEVLLHGMHWITLQKPSKSYEALIRTTLATLQCLHFAKRNPEADTNDVWNSLHKLDGIQTSEDDLSDQVSLLCEAMKRDEDLTKSKCLRLFLAKTSQTAHIEDENVIVNDNKDEESNHDDSETNMQFDPVCSICDNDGFVPSYCEGSCLRSFHPTIADGIDTACESLGFTNDTQVKAIATYLCNNCLHKQHQCYVCGELGSSGENIYQEVFACSASNCGHFYHPICVAKRLYSDDKIRSEEFQAKIVAGESFCCPLHICKACNLSEDKNMFPLHFAVCRRCPTAYHRKCLPSDEETFQRAWENLLPHNRILIYCLDHAIESHLLTPTRDHLIFPDVTGQRRTLSHGFVRRTEDVSSRVTYPKRHGGLFDRLGIEASRKAKKNSSVDEYLMKQKMDSTRKKLSKEGPSASPKPVSTDEDFDQWEVEQRVMSIINEVDSKFNFDDFVKSRGESHVKSYRAGNDINKIPIGMVEKNVKIMGLNPPFGHRASLANSFIKKALEFKPKILILIVPSETKRVDEVADYDLMWKDDNLLSGMSFYLPGSVDVNDQTIEQWNNSPPPLYLWSRRDWTRSHKTKALEHGHITQMNSSTYQENFHHAEIPRGGDDDGMVQDMEIE